MRLFLLAALLALAAPAHAESDLLTRTLSAHDLGRLAGFAKARSDAIAEARTGGDPAEVETLDAILAGEELPIGPDLRGDYRCRVAKLGGILPLVIYTRFECRISEEDTGYLLEKLTGSQRLTGHFIDDSETAMIFYGAGHYDYEEPIAYSADPERNVVGRFVRVGEGRYRLEMPLPQFESTFDILELQAR
jgi:hypothetical protein